ncbi:hypothetical protein MPC4_330003 [Methylocella tundrae]|uniref:Uncharacterized protein n=1 Tax=Methylocella tundrae TaxID=227605 RepID=A0A8B6M849_METTU|nr:hypothetical protein MPC1_1790003 [Methylocella tundrae]VTZ51203.1 hypothetical protein MPC4_330003 [Methylocella tundrae]
MKNIELTLAAIEQATLVGTVRAKGNSFGPQSPVCFVSASLNAR